MTDCRKCIYSNDCPTSYHQNNAACLTIYKDVHDSNFIISEDFRKQLNGDETYEEVLHKLIEYLSRPTKNLITSKYEQTNLKTNYYERTNNRII